MYKLNKHTLFILLTVIVLSALAFRWRPVDGPGFSMVALPCAEQQPYYHEQFISFGETAATHAATLTERDDGKLFAAWYAGSREGAKDVRIDSIVIDPINHALSPVRTIVSRWQTARDTQRYVRKLGNPIVHRLADGRLMLVYVSVPFGGWAASQLNISFSDDGGRRWSESKRLVTSPFINLSTLVKGAPLNLDNGHIGIPIYHEFAGKFSEFLLLDERGEIKDKRRISWGRDAIQPAIVPLTQHWAIALLRDSGKRHKRVGVSYSVDGGLRWSTPQPLALPNPDAAVTATTVAAGVIAMVFNNHEDERNDLTLAVSKDSGASWKVIYEFENEPLQPGKKVEFSYPYIIRDSAGDYHLLYTWHKKRIKYIHFNQAWLQQLL